jgi:TorA maturation chaperone TorD
MKLNELISYEEYRRDSYRLLSDCYYLPNEELVKTLNGLVKSRSDLFSGIAEYVPERGGVEPLQIDYSKLFVGPYGLLAPPYGSAYFEDARRVMGDSTMDVKSRYREEGLDIGLKEAPDHIAIELEFMYFLIFKEIEAIRNSDDGSAASYLVKQKAFLDAHLGIWVSEFTDNIAANAETEFYRNLARITESFVEKDRSRLDDNLTYSFRREDD